VAALDRAWLSWPFSVILKDSTWCISGQISSIRNGLLKMVADPTGECLLGVQIIGEGATELIHVGQIALQHAATVDSFVENIFNFPTLAETYRVAALDIVGQRQKRLASIAA
jgi:NAD(P) transhydrogenase